jgi:aryl-alcohol dehydrogenase-like predicted oxidoreductase
MNTSHYRTLGRTGLTVSPLALGTVELGMDYGIPVPGAYGRPSESAAERLVHAALDTGINLIDTAQAYGNSEAVLGRALRGRRQRAVLATKATVQADGKTLRGDALRRAMLVGLENSLRLLRTDYVDIWQIHNVDGDLLDQSDLVAEVFSTARASGMALWRGGSFYGPDLPLAALAHDLFDVFQVTYSVFDQRLADRLFPAATAQGVGIMVRSILLQGVLTERADHLPDRLQLLKAHSRRFRQLVASQGGSLTPAQAAIAFGLAEPRIGSILVGVRSEPELLENLVAATATLSPDLMFELRQLRIDDPEFVNPDSWQADLALAANRMRAS